MKLIVLAFVFNFILHMSVCLSSCLSGFEQDNSRMLCPRIMKFGHNIEWDNISNEFDIGQGWTKVKVTT